MKNNLYFNMEDISQISIGAFALAIPISFSEEAWRLGVALATENLILIVVLSITFLSLYAHQSVFQGDVRYRLLVFLFRVVIAYFIAGCVVALILTSLGKFPVFESPDIAIKRLIVVTMPASMGAIIVDGFDKE